MRFIFVTLKALLIVVSLLAVATFLFMQQKSFGRSPSGTRLERVKKSAQFKDGSFHNLEPTTLIAPDASYFGMAREFFSKGNNREPAGVLPSVKTDLRNLPDSATIVWFGHSSYLLHIDGKNILVDPVFSNRPSPVQYVGSRRYPIQTPYTAADMPNLDAIVITHDHYDHLDYNTIIELKGRTQVFITSLGIGAHLEHWGIEPQRIHEFDWWEGEEIFPGWQITATPARHFSGRGFTRNKTLWASYVLQTPSLKIYIGGDSGYSKAFKEIGDKFGPFDWALLECGQYNEKWPSIHMMPEQTVQAGIDLRARVLQPVHWGAFTLAVHPWNEPIQRATAEAKRLNVPVSTPLIGQSVSFGGPLPTGAWWDNVSVQVP